MTKSTSRLVDPGSPEKKDYNDEGLNNGPGSHNDSVGSAVGLFVGREWGGDSGRKRGTGTGPTGVCLGIRGSKKKR